MMKHKSRLFSLLVLTFLAFSTLTGCSGAKAVHFADVPERYEKTLQYHDGFVIAQLTDIHWNSATCIGNDEYGSKAYIKNLIRDLKKEYGNVDLIEITGDIFCLTNSRAVDMFIDMMEEIGIPYAITWGNHDRQNTFNANWLSNQFINAPYSLYTEVDNDDVHERSNYVINLVDGDRTVWQIVNLDSGASYREGAMDIGLEYDYIRQDQIDWFEFMHKRAGADVPVICYYHVPQKEFVEGYEACRAGENGYKSAFYKMEGISNSPYAVSLNDVFKQNCVKGVFVGHDHANDWTFTNPDGITYGFGLKTDKELYSMKVTEDNLAADKALNPEVEEEFDLWGASVVILKNASGDFDLDHVYYYGSEGSFNMVVEEY